MAYRCYFISVSHWSRRETKPGFPSAGPRHEDPPQFAAILIPSFPRRNSSISHHQCALENQSELDSVIGGAIRDLFFSLFFPRPVAIRIASPRIFRTGQSTDVSGYVLKTVVERGFRRLTAGQMGKFRLTVVDRTAGNPVNNRKCADETFTTPSPKAHTPYGTTSIAIAFCCCFISDKTASDAVAVLSIND